MQRLEFVVVGSQGDHYRVVFERVDNNLNGFCNCPAGINGQYCKHRFSLLNGEYHSIQEGKISDLQALKAMLAGTDLEVAYTNLIDAEKTFAEAKNKLDVARKSVALAMRR